MHPPVNQLVPVKTTPCFFFSPFPLGTGQIDAAADAEMGRRVRADGLDDAGTVLAGRVRQLRLARVVATADIRVDRIDAGCKDLD